MSLVKRALGYIKPYRKTFIIAIFFSIVYAVFNVIAMAFIMPVLGILFGETNQAVLQPPVFSGNISDLQAYISQYFAYYSTYFAEEKGPVFVLMLSCVAFIVSFFLRNVFSYFAEYFLIDLRSGVTRDFRIQLHDKILALPVSYFTEKRKGDILNRISNDVNEVEGNILNSLVEILRAPVTIIISLIALFTVSFELTIFALLVFPIMGTLISLVGKSLKRAARNAQNELSNILTYVDETVSSLRIIKIFNAEDQIKNRFNTSINRYRRYLQKVMRKRALASPMSEFLGAVTIGLIVFFGGKLSIEGNGLSGSEFIFYISIFYTMLDPIKRFSKSLSDIQKGEVSAKRIFEVLDADVNIRDLPTSIHKESFNHTIEFRNVTFGYEAGRPIIKNFNLTIEKGQSVAIVGQSGSGKSTIASLLTRFWDTNEGEILMDGENIKNIKLYDYRALFGLVTQDSILFNDSVANNITLGSNNVNEQQLRNAAQVANALEFIEKLPEKFDEIVGEGGGKLSGGQKQRLSIARAVYKNPPIMILDEATSALDTKSEKLVQNALENMMTNRTSLIIAHRLSTIQSADKIVVMDAGKIIEVGTHDSLLAQKGVYANLVAMQQFG
ncbi:ABC transporter transmembrane domain-containing protein [Weeksella virosa]|uniref:ABC transporter ATP-binding protein n=1 Tax=Weeksella virosa TaxID=1014 RepID=UPI002556934A|nr:ABC transporter transmembrane domain-containing protein [Weeksella virosa]MDK7375912.1 ABC transporter transmembrane domain-containing protein [Weeksella virosa]